MKQLFACFILLFPSVYLNNEIKICKRDSGNDQTKQEVPECFEDSFKDEKNIGDSEANFETEINKLKQVVKDVNKTFDLMDEMQTELNLLNDQFQELEVCSSNPCINGNCSLINSSYFCSCKIRFTGKNCETEMQPCEYEPCFSGNCTNLNKTDYNCTCHAGFTGRNCEIKIKPCDKKPCINGICSNLNETDYNCTCHAGFTGGNCETNINDCLPGVCPHATCVDQVNGYFCNCWSGKGNTCYLAGQNNCSVGMKAGDPRVQDSDITASTFWGPRWSPDHGRLNSVKFHPCWGPNGNRAGDWIRVDLKKPTSVTGVVTQGCGYDHFWVTSFTIAYSNSTINFQSIYVGEGEVHFHGNTDKDNYAFNKFPQPITARYFQAVVRSYNGKWPGMKMDYLTC